MTLQDAHDEVSSTRSGAVDRASPTGGVTSVLVVGAGTMGRGIAQVAAEAGVRTQLFDSDAGAIQRGLDGIDAAWNAAVAKQRRKPDEIASFRAAISMANSIEAAGSVDVVIEAVFESLAAKEEVFRILSDVARPKTLLATNTSSLSIDRLAGSVEGSDRFIGMHFFNPVPVLPLVEVVRGRRTSDATVARAVAFVEQIGKTPIVVNDSPGFVVNRLLIPFVNEAVACLEAGVAPAEGIDTMMRLGANHPIGPLALADLIGLDVCLQILESLERDLGDAKYRPAPLLRQMVADGKLGRKVGQGFYDYPPRPGS